MPLPSEIRQFEVLISNAGRSHTALSDIDHIEKLKLLFQHIDDITFEELKDFLNKKQKNGKEKVQSNSESDSSV